VKGLGRAAQNHSQPRDVRCWQILLKNLKTEAGKPTSELKAPQGEPSRRRHYAFGISPLRGVEIRRVDRQHFDRRAMQTAGH
jgi:hypothetical protein